MSYASTVAGMPGVVAHWTLDETSGGYADLIGSHSLTVNGTVTRGVAALVSDGGAAVGLPGTAGNNLSTPASADFAFGTGDFWIAMWVKSTAASAVIMGGQAGDWYIYTNADWRMHGAAAEILTTGATVNDGATHFGVFTRVSGVLSIYVDGSASANVSASVPGSYAFSNPLTLGDLNGGGFGWAGTMDGVAIGKGAGLTGAQAHALYVAGTSAPSASFAVSPTSATAGTPLTITATGAATSWTTGTTFSVSGGTAASISGTSVNAGTQVATFTLDPGSAAGTLTISDSTDAATATVTVSTATPPALAFNGPLAVASNTPAGGVSVSFATTTTGTGAKTYKLYRASAPFASAGSGTLAASGSGSPLADAAPGPGIAYYLATVTDSAGPPATATSSQSAYQSCLVVAPKTATINVINVGDSITAGVGASGASAYAATLLGGLMAEAFPAARVNAGGSLNKGASGTTSADWASGSLLAGAVGAIVAGQVNLVPIMLGVNDAKTAVLTSASAYRANLAATCSAILGAGGVPILFPPPYVSPAGSSWDEANTLPALVGYRDQVLALADNATIFLGSATTFGEFAALYQTGTAYTADGVHPDDAGHAILANLWFAGVARVAATKTGLVPAAAGVANFAY